MVWGDGVEEIEIDVVVVGWVERLDDREVVEGGVEGGDVGEMGRVEGGVIGFRIGVGEKGGVEGEVEEEWGEVVGGGGGMVRNIGVEMVDK